MNKKDFSNLEDQIMSTVNNALKAVDIANLKKDINDRTGDTLNQFKSKFNGYSEKYMNLNKRSKKDVSAYINKKPPGRVSGILYLVFGGIGCFIYGSSLFTVSLTRMFFGGFFTMATNVVLATSFLFFAISLGLLLRGIYLRRRINRFKKYVRVIDNNSYILIKDLARFVNEKETFVVKDLRKMIDLGMFYEGHIDDQYNYFMLNNEVYRDYLNLINEQRAKERNKQKEKEEINTSENKEVNSTIEIGRKYIEQIKIVRNNLCKEDIAVKLDKLISVSTQILDYVEKNPNKTQEVNKFINHYLPITIKLINSYKELNNQYVKGDNIKNAKIEIEKSIDLINDAFENLLDDLYEDMALDISTDISVLKTLFKQEGLTEEDFKK